MIDRELIAAIQRVANNEADGAETEWCVHYYDAEPDEAVDLAGRILDAAVPRALATAAHLALRSHSPAVRRKMDDLLIKAFVKDRWLVYDALSWDDSYLDGRTDPR